MTQRVAFTSTAHGLCARLFSKSLVFSRNRASGTRIFPARPAKIHSESHFQTPTSGRNKSLRPAHSKESTRRIRDATRQQKSRPDLFLATKFGKIPGTFFSHRDKTKIGALLLFPIANFNLKVVWRVTIGCHLRGRSRTLRWWAVSSLREREASCFLSRRNSSEQMNVVRNDERRIAAR
ncbi:MAG TPA: hypothetical protein PK156_45850, partial [Polyangium sp.]|nr:hypothetical protein [Polyangium sp.]